MCETHGIGQTPSSLERYPVYGLKLHLRYPRYLCNYKYQYDVILVAKKQTRWVLRHNTMYQLT